MTKPKLFAVLLATLCAGSWAFADDLFHTPSLRVLKSRDVTGPPYAGDSNYVVITRADYDRIAAIPRKYRKADATFHAVEMTAGEKASADTTINASINLDDLVASQNRLDALTAARAELVSAGKSVTAIDALITAETAVRDAAVAALP